MVDPEQVLKDQIQYWSEERRKAALMVKHFREALNLLKGKSSGAKKSTAPKRKTAKTRVYELLSETKERFSQAEIRRALSERGVDYSRQAVNLALMALVDTGKIQRFAAPSGYTAQYVYGLPVEAENPTNATHANEGVNPAQ